MLRLGMMYETGQGVPRDAARASRWYRAAASGTPWKEQRP
ncbi:MAG: SEL1-like repeat protein [Planctomycetota bacterium]